MVSTDLRLPGLRPVVLGTLPLFVLIGSALAEPIRASCGDEARILSRVEPDGGWFPRRRSDLEFAVSVDAVAVGLLDVESTRPHTISDPLPADTVTTLICGEVVTSAPAFRGDGRSRHFKLLSATGDVVVGTAWMNQWPDGPRPHGLLSYLSDDQSISEVRISSSYGEPVTFEVMMHGTGLG